MLVVQAEIKSYNACGVEADDVANNNALNLKKKKMYRKTESHENVFG